MPLVLGDPLERVAAVRHSGLLAPARRLDMQLGRRDPVRTLTLWQSSSGSMYALGADLVAYDREARRAVALLRQRGRLTSWPRPIPERDGHFRVLDAGFGSLDLVIDGVGLLALALQSQPVQLLLTIDAIVGRARSLRAWVSRRSDPLAGISAGDALTVLRAYGELEASLGEAQASLELPPRRFESPSPATESAPEVTQATGQGVRVRGHRITHVRILPDGTVDVLVVE
jgi:hypothetical protein